MTFLKIFLFSIYSIYMKKWYYLLFAKYYPTKQEGPLVRFFFFFFLERMVLFKYEIF